LLETRRRNVVDLPWAWLRQVHGAEVVSASAANLSDISGTDGDALVSNDAAIALAVQTADCAAITFWSAEGVIGIAHAGWRGLEAGIVGTTTAAMRAMGATVIDAQVGPYIHVECYEFGDADLDRLASRFGPPIRGKTANGGPALDMARLVEASLANAGVRRIVDDYSCTACDAPRWYSHRARAESGRMATVIWMGEVANRSVRSGDQ